MLIRLPSESSSNTPDDRQNARRVQRPRPPFFLRRQQEDQQEGQRQPEEQERRAEHGRAGERCDHRDHDRQGEQYAGGNDRPPELAAHQVDHQEAEADGAQEHAGARFAHAIAESDQGGQSPGG